MQLVKIIRKKGIIHCETGLRIGGSKDSIEIGGLDNPIIRHPITDLPYIPGSSFKGKLRSLLESVYGRKNAFDEAPKKGEPCGCGKCYVCRVFGPHKNTKHELGPTRLIVRDARLTAESEAELKEAQLTKGIFFSEIKTENTINRDKGMAINPRPYERVPEGTAFELEMMIKIYDVDNESEILHFIKEGLELMEHDYLGSSGSRGYGKVRIETVEQQEVFLKNSIKE
ncbi:type III-A CRISPR-associated RAMP protein Csm3 [Cytobacillus dafuensis]|uniref:CRISPR system Cms endoribonuclease Csm3 n=1 Tax=Cytobacillus dafuensis TaxID=1742359 RepID=A0A5B8Z8W0_CYTDA|nr:type III-A CRISPR-associated RAMP protein Csm3 [Cytobacillus dafuensis]QED48149.1 type III-A CRISPR-associated RAMP protein Csm3 [Cytobacillus dafuensis]